MDGVIFLMLAPAALSALSWALGKLRRHGEAPGVVPLRWLLGLACGWLLCDTFELLAREVSTTLFWFHFTYVFVILVPVAWLAFALEVSGYLRHPSLRQVLGLSTVPLFMLGIAYTNGLHGLFLEEILLITLKGGFLHGKAVYGPMFWLMAAYAYALMVTGTLLLIFSVVRAGDLYRQQARLIILGAVVPLCVNVVYILRLVPDLHMDFTTIGFGMGAFLFTLGIRRLGKFDLRPVAHAQLLSMLQEGFVVLDRQHHIVELNPAAHTLLEAQHTAGSEASSGQATDLIGRPIEEVLPMDFRLEGQPDSVQDFETHIQGEARYFDLRTTILRDANRQPTGRLLLFHDVTAHRRNEQALREANRALQVKTEDLDAFARTVAHDLKGPVQGVLGAAQFLEEELDTLDPEELRELVSVLARSGAKMDSIIEELLLLAGVRQAPVRRERVEMQGCVAEAMERLHTDLQEAGAEVAVGDLGPAALGYAPWMEEVWVNYLSNAIKYGGTPPRIMVGGTLQANGYVRFWVRDNGKGISRELQPQLFVPFTRLHQAKRDGHGLGLSIVHRIVTRLGGTVGVESAAQHGEGSTFYFTLPAACLEEAHGELV